MVRFVWQYILFVFIHTSAELSYSSAKQIDFCDTVMAMSRKVYASLSALPSLFVGSTIDLSRDFATRCDSQESFFGSYELCKHAPFRTQRQWSTFHPLKRINNEQKRWIQVSEPYSAQRERDSEVELITALDSQTREKPPVFWLDRWEAIQLGSHCILFWNR